MINNLYNIGLTSLQNAQVSVDNASNNIANADTTGYQRTKVVYESGDSITINGLTVGTGAEIAAIQSQKDIFVEAQYLDASADLARQKSSYEYLSQLDSLFNPTDGGMNDILDKFFAEWNELTTAPDFKAAREDLLGKTNTLIYDLNSANNQLEKMEATINTEIQNEINKANSLVEKIAKANAAIVANPDDNQTISNRDQDIRELDAILGLKTIPQQNGEVTIMTNEGYTLVDGTETHTLVYGSPQATQTLLRDSDYDGSLQYSGSSSEELLIEFISTGPDGSAQFRVSTDGGNSWREDADGDTQLFTAGDGTNSVEIEGVEIWFDGSNDHMQGDRYTVIPKSGLYWETGDGALHNITPMTDEAGADVSGRTASGSLAGLFTARDDTVIPTSDDMDNLAESLILEVNNAHSKGAGLEHHTALTSSFSVEDSTAALSNSGLHYGDMLQAGEMQLMTYDANGDVGISAIISIDPTTDSMDDIISDINTAFAGELKASLNAEGQLQLSANSHFEIAGDSSNLLAAAGMNTFFTGTDASTIALDSYVTTNTNHINTSQVGTDRMVPTAGNKTANAIAELSNQAVTIGDQETSLSTALATTVADIGSAASSTELKQIYAQTSAQYFYDQQASASEVSVDEELIELTKHQQAYQAAAEIITVTRQMMSTILDMV